MGDRPDIIDVIATDDSEQSMDKGSNQNIVTAEIASAIASNSDDSDSAVSTSLASNMVSLQSFCTSDPATWRQLSSVDRESIVCKGPPKIPSSFPYDTKGRTFPDSIFAKTLPNCETVSRDWLVWSQSKHCFPCCLLNKYSTSERYQVQESLSKLARPNAGMTDNWRRLYAKIHSHECNSAHLSHYCDWKALEKICKNAQG